MKHVDTGRVDKRYRTSFEKNSTRKRKNFLGPCSSNKKYQLPPSKNTSNVVRLPEENVFANSHMGKNEERREKQIVFDIFMQFLSFSQLTSEIRTLTLRLSLSSSLLAKDKNSLC